jgi:hypothetical protein
LNPRLQGPSLGRHQVRLKKVMAMPTLGVLKLSFSKNQLGKSKIENEVVR